MNKPKGMPSNEMIADGMARKVFAKRGNRPKAYVTELELASIINAALESYEAMAERLNTVD
jgi:hypothetical protein